MKLPFAWYFKVFRCKLQHYVNIHTLLWLMLVFYCPQSFSGGGLYLKVKWLLWSVYDGLLWSVKNGLLWIGKNGLLWYMVHTCQFGVQWWHFLTVKGNCCFLWCFYTSVWLDHLISSFYLVWVIRANFWGSGHALWGNGLLLFFYGVSIHQYSQFIIYHHCIWYGRWRANLGGSGDAFGGNG